MTFKELVRPTNRNIRLLVGLLLIGLFCIQCTRTEAFKQSSFISVIDGKVLGHNDPIVVKRLETLARTDHVALLNDCLRHCRQNYRDYTCTLIKQERIGGQLGREQWIDVKFLGQPFSVAMKWTRNAPIGDQVLYVEGRYDNKMLVKPKGLLGNLVGTVLRQPDGSDALKNTLRPVNLFGFERNMQNLLQVYAQARKNGDLKEGFDGYREVAGRKALLLTRFLPAAHDYPAQKTLIFIDAEYLVPICVEAYDWNDKLSSRYLYKDVKFNVGLASDDFLPEANGLPEPADARN